MYNDDIEELNKWFDDDERSYFTSYNEDGEYSVSQSEVDDFCDFLSKLDSDLVGIRVMIGGDGIWFRREDLKKARHY